MMAKPSSMIMQSSNPLRRYLPAIARGLLLAAVVCGALPLAAPAATPEPQGLKPILTYISSGWDTLTRSMTDCTTVVDPKIKASPVVYLPAGYVEPAAVQKL